MSRKKKSRSIAANTQTPPVSLSERKAELLCVAAIILLSCALILPNLGNIYLWGDEAQTALVAKTVITHGFPVGSDGKNYFSSEKGKEYGNNHIWRWHPWLPFYVLAGFYAVFGVSTFTARLPFALFGIGTILLAYCYGKSLWRTRRAGVLAAVLLVTSVPFLLLVRQCRYYSLAAFFSLAGLYAYSEMVRGRRYASAAFVISACLLFHTFYVYVPALLAAVIIHAALYHKERLKGVLVASLIVAAVNLPWMIYFAGVYRAAHAELDMAQRITVFTVGFLDQIVKYVFPPVLLIAVLVTACSWIWRGCPSIASDNRRKVMLMLIYVACVLAVLAPTSPSMYFRYLAPVIPVLILVGALVLDSGMRIHPAVGLVALVLLAYWAKMPGYLYEITHDYNGPAKGIAKYLNEHGRPDDVLAVSHEPLPLMFYTNMRVINGTSGEDFSPALDATWVVPRAEGVKADAEFTHYINTNVPWEKYEVITLDCPDITFENREDPGVHNFRTVEDAQPVIIARRVRP